MIEHTMVREINYVTALVFGGRTFLIVPISLVKSCVGQYTSRKICKKRNPRKEAIELMSIGNARREIAPIGEAP